MPAARCKSEASGGEILLSLRHSCNPISILGTSPVLAADCRRSSCGVRALSNRPIAGRSDEGMGYAVGATCGKDDTGQSARFGSADVVVKCEVG